MKKRTSLVPKPLILFGRNIRMLFSYDLRRGEWDNYMRDKTQRGLSQLVQMQGDQKEFVHLPEPHSEINTHEYKIFSQNGEDGILVWLLSKIGSGSKTFVEFGSGSGRECTAANLVLTFGWRGLMMDGSERNVASARSFFKYLMPWSEYEKLEIKKAFVTRENINTLITESSVGTKVDLLSIDIDGNDFWIWEAIDSIDPRIVVIEYNATFGKTKSVTVPYKPDFDVYAEHPLGLYHGASLPALVTLGKRKGYSFVGCDSFGVNAFFVKDEYAGIVTPVTAHDAFYDNQHKLKRGSQAAQFKLIEDKPLVEIEK
jgi:hypothetical protein